MSTMNIFNIMNIRFEVTISLSSMMFGWSSCERIRISLMAVIGNYAILV